MLGLIAPTLIALVLALALGGSLRGLVGAAIVGWPALVACFTVELLLYNPPLDTEPWAMQVGPWLWLATRCVFLGVVIGNTWAARNGTFWPWGLAAFGLAMNTLVIALNEGHMPQSTEAALLVWGHSHIDPHRLQNVVALGPETRLPWLGDVVPEPAWVPRENVVSVGDILLALGVASWVFVTARNGTTRQIQRTLRCGSDGGRVAR